MEGVRLAHAKPYFPPKHADVRCLRLQGFEASGAANFSVGLSHFLPGGGAELDATPLEKVYVVVQGEVTVTTSAGSVTLAPLDSCRLAPGEPRSISNATNLPASMLVIMPYPLPEGSGEPRWDAPVHQDGRS